MSHFSDTPVLFRLGPISRYQPFDLVFIPAVRPPGGDAILFYVPFKWCCYNLAAFFPLDRANHFPRSGLVNIVTLATTRPSFPPQRFPGHFPRVLLASNRMRS